LKPATQNVAVHCVGNLIVDAMMHRQGMGDKY